MRESSFVNLAGDRIDRSSGSGRRLGAERAGGEGLDQALGDPIRRAAWTRDGVLSSHHPAHPLEDDDRGDGLGAARGGMIAVLFGLPAWTMILFSLRRLLS